MAFKLPEQNPDDKPGAPEIDSQPKPAEPVNPTPQLARKGLDFRPIPTNEPSVPPPSTPVEQPSAPAVSADHHQRLNYLREVRQGRPAKSHKLRNIILIILLIIILGGGAAGAAYWLKTHPPKPAPKQAASSQTNPSTNQPADNQPAQPTSGPFTSQTKQIQSNNFGLTMDYPATWTATDSPKAMTITSPVTNLTDASGQVQAAAIVLTVQPKQASLPQFSKGNAVAVIDSEKVAYTSPSPTQRGQTYLSFLQYATTTTKGGLDGVYITGNAGYKKGQAIPEVDVAKVDPLITVTFQRCADKDCAVNTRSPLTIAASDWQGDFQTAVEKMLKSLSIQ